MKVSQIKRRFAKLEERIWKWNETVYVLLINAVKLKRQMHKGSDRFLLIDKYALKATVKHLGK